MIESQRHIFGRNLLLLLFPIAAFTACYKWQSGYKDTAFRNKFTGKWKIDSIAVKAVVIRAGIKDTAYTLQGHPGDFLEIPFTKNQLKQPKICTGTFLDSTFQYELQGWRGKPGMLCFMIEPDANAKLEITSYFHNCKNIILYDSQLMVLENTWAVNNMPCSQKIFLKKQD
ncbi:MAG: hypothetical protein JNL57_01190 [Bacteroidetes bacterium]|nr:hypothetical protein [Bacteroidota bacterium]